MELSELMNQTALIHRIFGFCLTHRLVSLNLVPGCFHVGGSRSVSFGSFTCFLSFVVPSLLFNALPRSLPQGSCFLPFLPACPSCDSDSKFGLGFVPY